MHDPSWKGSMSTRIIGFGNTILSDDGVGIYAVREISRRLGHADGRPALDIVESEVAGFALMELLAGCRRAILVDAIQFDDLEPGTVVRIEPHDLRTSLRIRSVHEIDLPTVLALGRHLGLSMPEEVAIFGIQAEDSCTFGESLSASVTSGMQKAVDLILAEVADSGRN
jgi:hydrogenase maturation protease